MTVSSARWVCCGEAVHVAQLAADDTRRKVAFHELRSIVSAVLAQGLVIERRKDARGQTFWRAMRHDSERMIDHEGRQLHFRRYHHRNTGCQRLEHGDSKVLVKRGKYEYGGGHQQLGLA